jgi:hypothetical protein
VDSGRRSGVPVEGGSDVVAAASGVVLRLEAKVRGELRALRQSGTKSTARGKNKRYTRTNRVKMVEGCGFTTVWLDDRCEPRSILG